MSQPIENANVPKVFGIPQENWDALPADAKAALTNLASYCEDRIAEQQEQYNALHGRLIRVALVLDDLYCLVPAEVMELFKATQEQGKQPNIMAIAMQVMQSGLLGKLGEFAKQNEHTIKPLIEEILTHHGAEIKTARDNRAIQRDEEAQRRELAAALGE